MGFLCSFPSLLPDNLSFPLLPPWRSPLRGHLSSSDYRFCLCPVPNFWESESLTIGVSCALLVQLWPGEGMARDMWLSFWRWGLWSLWEKGLRRKLLLLLQGPWGTKWREVSGSQSSSPSGRGRISAPKLMRLPTRPVTPATWFLPSETWISWWDQISTTIIETHTF